MKFLLKSFLPWVVIATVALPLFALDTNQPISTVPALRSGPGLTWKKVNPDGSETVETQLADKPRRFVAVITVHKQDGTAVQIPKYALDVKNFRGSATYYARLPQTVRLKPTFVNFIISCTVGSKPDNGSVINVDGAIFGFQVTNVGSEKNPVYRAKAAYMDTDANGKKVWKPLNYGISIQVDKGITGSPKLGVYLDYAHHSWAFYRSDILIKGNLPLFSEDGPPKISLRAGLLDTDVLALKDLEISNKPYSRPDFYLPVVNGKIDFAKAIRERDPRLRPAGGNATPLKPVR